MAVLIFKQENLQVLNNIAWDKNITMVIKGNMVLDFRIKAIFIKLMMLIFNMKRIKIIINFLKNLDKMQICTKNLTAIIKIKMK